MKKYLFKILLSAGVGMTSLSTSAGIAPLSESIGGETNIHGFLVDYVRVDASGKGYVNFVDKLEGSIPACTNIQYYAAALAFDTNTDGGKAILTAALTAKAAGNTIRTVGSGKCDIYGVMEDWDWGSVK